MNCAQCDVKPGCRRFCAVGLGLSAQQFVARHSPSTRRVESAEQCSQQSLPIIQDPKIDINSLKDWIQFAEEHGGKFVPHCAICNQWCSAKTGGVKAHLRSCHPEHAQAMKDAEARLRHHYRLKYKGQCRASGFKPASTQSLTRPAKCPTYFQACVLHYIQYPEAKLHVGRSGHEGGLPDVRLPPASSSERCNSVHSPAKLDGVHTGPQGDQPQEGSHAGGELGQGPMELAADRMERPVPFSAGLGGTNCGE